MRSKTKQLRLLDIAAYSLVSGAILFSLFCVLRTNWSQQQPIGHAGTQRLLSGLETGAEAGAKAITLSQRALVDSPVVQSPCPTSKPLQIVSSAVNIHNPRKYHLVTTCQGFSNHWQARIHYYW
jgi:hypothetical protein